MLEDDTRGRAKPAAFTPANVTPDRTYDHVQNAQKRLDGTPSLQTPANVAPSKQYDHIKNGQRRLYETPKQKDAELAMVNEFAYHLGMRDRTVYSPKTISAFEKIDYTLHYADYKAVGVSPSRVVAAVECKSHSHNYGTYKNYMLDHKNWTKLMSVGQLVPAYLLVGYNDGLYYLDPASLDLNFYNSLTLHAGGRTDRNDPNDILLKVNFPIVYLSKIDNLVYTGT